MEQTINQNPIPPPIYPPQPVFVYAGFWKRFAAHLIDKLILSVASMIILIPLIALIGFSRFISRHDVESMALIFSMILVYIGVGLLIFIADWLYFAIMESQRGATIGKMALGIVVTDLQGKKITFGKATGRYFAKIISGMILYIGYMMAGWTRQKQALHDMLAGTLVVEKKW